MDYERITVQDCMEMKTMKGQGVVLMDGHVKGFRDERHAAWNDLEKGGNIC